MSSESRGLQDSVVVLADFEAEGGIAEDRAVLLGAGEQGSQGDQGVAASMAVQLVNRGLNVAAGDFTEVVVAVRPGQQDRPDPVHVSPDSCRGSCLVAWAAIVQDPQPGLDVPADPGGEAVELAGKPILERGPPVVAEHAHALEHVASAADSDHAFAQEGEHLRVQDGLSVDPAS
ncbi:hypothetical protein [Microbispora sp. GKU 823]|uniref:hypothetical protein n=1 Tax=Microbispora sp. GKU 823 TaxID=1652100 RepID=UPI00117F8EAA|nr:hypothetical protein [Microbispora sp. GKU 823]